MFYHRFMRTVCVYIPHFYLQVELLKNPAIVKQPVVIIDMPEKRELILDCSEDLVQRGVKPPMSLKDASHLCFDAAHIPARRKEYREVWDAMLSLIASITLRIEPWEPGTAFLDITRLPGMYKSEEKVARALVHLIAEKFHTKVAGAVGNSRFLALEAALCTSQDTLVVPSGGERKFLSRVAIERLPVADDVLERLALLGIHSLGQLSAFTLSALTSQFGATGKKLWEISNGIEEQDRIPCLFTVADIDEEMVCDAPICSRGQITIALLNLLEKLCRELEDIKMACRMIKLVFDLQNKTFFERHFVFHKATACKDDMMRRVMAGIDHVELTSPIRIMSVRASSLEPYTGQQEKLFKVGNNRSKAIKDIGGFLKTKYGSMPVVRVVHNDVGSLLPEERFLFVEP
ncbi:MAG: DNA polymerase IV [Syntrophorhabdus sp. PtaU1.Bin153]|nr:MAG: DNA polymerase IV [Syntrophorhabdus sp. PtaU1.Bin153]